MTDKTCTLCDRVFRHPDDPPTPGTAVYKNAGKCSTCYSSGRAPTRWDGLELLAEIDHLQDHPENVLRRLNVTAVSIQKTAYRYGRPDIARQFGALAKRKKQK